MKKNEYVTPEMEIVEIKTESFIATSDPFGETFPGQGEGGGDGNAD